MSNGICTHDHDQLPIPFSPDLARTLGVDWNGARPTTISLATASKAELVHVAAACLAALGDYVEDGQHVCCMRLVHAAQDAVAQMVPKLIDAFDRGADFKAESLEIVGDACRGGWEG